MEGKIFDPQTVNGLNFSQMQHLYAKEVVSKSNAMQGTIKKNA
jgi:hypothetical protein